LPLAPYSNPRLLSDVRGAVERLTETLVPGRALQVEPLITASRIRPWLWHPPAKGDPLTTGTDMYGASLTKTVFACTVMQLKCRQRNVKLTPRVTPKAPAIHPLVIVYCDKIEFTLASLQE
jgi:hypothetical protein